MYIIKAQYKHNKAVVIDQVDRKEDVFNLCVEYLFSFGDGWKVWYTTKKQEDL